MAQGKIELGGKSAADLEKAVQADPNEPLTHVALSLAYWNAKKWDDVNKELNTALALDPRNGMAHLVLAMVPYAQNPRLWKDAASASGVPAGMVDEVARSDEHYKLAFFNDPATDIRIMATVSGSISAAEDTEAELAKGLIACHEGRYADCGTAMESYWAKNKGQASGVAIIPRASYWYNGLALIQQKNFASAAGNIGLLATRTDDDTRKMTAKDLTRVPLTSRDMEMMSGVIQYKLNNQPVDALNIFQRVIAADPNNYLAHVYAANIYDAQKNYERAIAEREAALKVNSTDPMLHYELGLTLAKANKIADAVPHLEKATQLMPKYTPAWYYLGLAKEGTDKAAAKEAYAKAAANATAAQAKTQMVTNAKAKSQ